MDAPQSLEAELFSSVIVMMLRKGIISRDDMAEVAEEFERRADEHGEGEAKERLEQLAHLASCLILEAAAPPVSEWRADQRRSRFRVIESNSE